MYLMKALRVEHIKSKRTMLNVIPFVLSIIVVFSILFFCRTSSKDEIVSESIHYWINISAMIDTTVSRVWLVLWENKSRSW